MPAIKRLAFFIFFLLIFSSPLSAEDLQASAVSPNAALPVERKEKEYDDAKVLLIDHQKGMLGIVVPDAKGGKEEKYSFQVDPKEVYVTNPMSQYLEFSDIAVGDRVDIYTSVDANGKETVIDIWDYDQVEKD